MEKESEVEEDIQLVKTGLELLENDYLGGSGSRGYGKVKFENLSIKPVLGDYDIKGLDTIVQKWNYDGNGDPKPMPIYRKALQPLKK